MKLVFKKESEVANTVQEMYNKRETMLNLAKQIIEDKTGCKLKQDSRLGYIYCFSFTYNFVADRVYFEEHVENVPGYKKGKDEKGNTCFFINKRTKIGKEIIDAFSKKIIPIDSRVLNEYGIYTEYENAWYSWHLKKEEDDSISMPIHPAIFNLIDFDKAKDVTVIK